MMLIVHFLLLWLAASVEFHLDKQIPLCCMNSIKAITPLLNGGIAVQAASPSVTILNGDNFSTKIAEIQADLFVSTIITTPEGGVFFGNSSKIIAKATQKHTNTAFSEDILWGNMVLTDNYALIGQFDLTSINLIKLDLQKLQVQTLKYTPRQGSADYMPYLKDLKNGQIILAKAYTIYLLNNQTLQVEQQLGDAQMAQGQDFTGIDSYWTEQDSLILVQKGSSTNTQYATYRYSFAAKQFQPFNKFYKQSNPFILTSPNTAVSIWQQNLIYWQNFDKQIIAQSWDPSEYIGIEWNQIAVGNALVSPQNIFAMMSSLYVDQIRIASLTTDNKIITNFTYSKSQGNLLQAKFTSLDQYLVYNIQSKITFTNKLYKLDMSAKLETVMMDGDQPTNALAFLIMGDVKLIVFVNRTIGNQTKNYIQLRDIANFSLVSQLQLQFNSTPSKYKLLADSTLWNFSFILLVQSQNDSSDTSTVLMFKYVSSNESIQLLSSQSRNFVFEYTFACDKYLVNVLMSSSLIQVYYVQNLTLAKTIPNQFQFDTFFSQKNMLVAQSSGSVTSFFDFSLDISNFEQGIFFRQYYDPYVQPNMKVLFPKRNIYLLCSNGFSSQPNYPNKLIYDLNNIPIKKWQPVPVTSNLLAIIMMQSSANNSCIWTFMINGLTLLKHNDCDPSNPETIIYTSILYPKLFISKNKKYLFVIYNSDISVNSPYMIQIRLTSNIGVLMKKMTIQTCQDIYDIDITQDPFIIIHLSNHIMVFDLEQQENIDNLDIQSIDLFHASQNIVSMIGKSSSNPNISLLIVKDISNPSPLLSLNLNSLPKIVKLSQSATRVAVYGSDSKLSVWDIKSQILITQLTNEGVVDMRFINDTQIALQFASNVSIISLNSLKAITQNQLSLNFTKIATNSDGTLFAVLVSPTNVKVLDVSMNEVANFIAPANSNIVDVGFSSTDEVYGVTSDGTLFVLSPTPCPATFLNIDSVCLCPQNMINTTGFCCPNGLTYVNSQCIECSFMCSSCDGTGTFDCTQYSSIFIIGITGIVVIAVSLAVIISCIVKRKREKLFKEETNLTENKDGISKDQSSLSEQLYGEAKDK